MATRQKQTYSKMTYKQLLQRATSRQRQMDSAQKSTRQTFNGRTKRQYQNELQKDFNQICKYLKREFLRDLEDRIKQSQTQIAKRKGLKINSPKATSTMLKKLKERRNKLKRLQRSQSIYQEITNKRSRTKTRAKPKAKTQSATKRKSVARTKQSTRNNVVSLSNYRRQIAALRTRVQKIAKKNDNAKRLSSQVKNQSNNLGSHFVNMNREIRDKFTNQLRFIAEFKEGLSKMLQITRNKKLSEKQKLRRITNWMERFAKRANNKTKFRFDKIQKAEQDCNRIVKLSRQIEEQFKKRSA